MAIGPGGGQGSSGNRRRRRFLQDQSLAPGGGGPAVPRGPGAPQGQAADVRMYNAPKGTPPAETKSPFANYKPGSKAPQVGPNLQGGDLQAKLEYLRARRDYLQQNPVTQAVGVTQSGGKQQDKINYVLQRQKEIAKARAAVPEDMRSEMSVSEMLAWLRRHPQG